MKRLFLAIILLVGFLLRVISLDNFPVGFTPDEASFGYDAYSILKTGKDQWGKTLPLTLESFGDHKSPLYTYISVPFVALLGLSKLAVRLPNAIIGTLAIYVLFLLIRELKKTGSLEIRNSVFEIFAPALLSISPWHIMMSRGAFEANLTTLLLPLAIYFFVKGLKDPKYFIWSSVAIGLNLFSYHSAKLVTPILFVAAILIYRKEIFKDFGIYKKISLGILILMLGLFILSMKGGSSTRIFDVSIFKTSLLEASSERIKAIGEGMNPILARFVYNKFVAGIRHFFGNWVTYFSPQFFFSQGPGESTYGMIPGRGVMYWFELPLIIAGFLYLIKNISIKSNKIFLIWFLLAPIPAALSIGPGYAANRAVIVLPVIQIISAMGLIILLDRVKAYKHLKLVITAFSLTTVMFFGYFALDYFLLSPQKSANGMLYGNYEALKYVSENYSGRNIIVSRKLSEPHIYVAFVNNWDPNEYQINTKAWVYKNMGLGWVDQIPEYRLGNYTFKNINFNEYINKSVVLVGKPEEFPEKTSFDKLILFPNGDKAVGIVDTFNQKYASTN